ncbi:MULTISPECIES: LysR family transcriptional regulator [unclassified Variovorax]|uniref:LysR family transcriptional regulator n=1 Tax=unclassified Variovorax TaxID=663243 RepID=UPI0008BA9459|nr:MULTISPECIES: LysR family transcriptional regulator [unclassified Variovorax]SEJ75602.1 DNA-binding transcriptional regulator, LysR family [Variovorax sp. OK202]SFC88457.1 DNA-binding transcriptional regulator, LysR family [Variovorax sp. OK212]
MIQIEDMQLAAALLREPSLSAAARALDVTPPALSMRLRKLEAALGLSLATRTARRLSLTPEGERFAREAAALLGQIEGLRESMQRDDQRLTGTLRIAAPFGYGRQYIAPMLVRFARLHPGLHMQLDLRETPWPDRHDADAVIHIGAVRDSSWVARTLSANERWLCASPDYLRQRGTPRVPRDVMAHDCICIRENDEDVTLWHLRPAKAGAGKRAAARETLRISPAYVTNDGAVARQWAEQGMGLVLRSEWDAAEAVARGTLVRVLADWQFDSAPVTLLVPNRKGRTARVQAIVGFLVESFGAARK